MKELDQAHFESIPWCSRILSDPNFAITPTFSRQFKASTEDSLIAETLQTPSTIPSCLSMYRIPSERSNWINEVRTLMTLGTGMNGGAYRLHGGIIATLMDDVIGTLLTVNKDQDVLPLSSSTVTAFMNIRYLKPVETPQTVLVVAVFTKVEGRKFFAEAELRDCDGKVLAKADSLWVKVQISKANL